jgi:DNA polymerase I-like protein with 3'-5' exonuclease and polymerase domains/5'-3' exonuclease
MFLQAYNLRNLRSPPPRGSWNPLCYTPPVSPKSPKKLFLIDAMGFIFRAFYVPIGTSFQHNGVPTKVPYLFSNMLRRVTKELQPDYVAVVFDPSGPTFRDKLFTDYKAQRQPMPNELFIQIPFVRRLCEAMRLPILEVAGYEADDVIGALARQSSRRDVDVYIVTSDKDMMQLVGGRVRVLRPGQPPAKPDVILDSAKVEEVMGVPPEQVADVMALMGDSIDNIPGAKGIGDKGARDLIRRFGSVEATLDHASEVENKRYREALINCREQVLLSKQLARISGDVPVELDWNAVARREPDWAALRDLYAELGFTSLLKDLPAVTTTSSVVTDYGSLDSAGAVREFLDAQPQDRSVAVSLVLDSGAREIEGYGARVAGFELSPGPGVGRFAWCDPQGEIIAPLRDFLADPKRPKIVHDPKLIELLVGPLRGPSDAVMLYSFLLRPTTAQHGLPEIALRHLNLSLSGAPGEHADYLQRLAPLLRQEVETQELVPVFEKIDLPLASVLSAMERHGIRVDPAALATMSASMENEIRTLEACIWELAGTEFNINSPPQLAEILFDKLNLAPTAKRSRARSRSTAADILTELALLHELPRKVLEYRELAKLKSTYVDALPPLIEPATGRLHTRFSQTGAATGRLSSSDPNLQNIPVRTELSRQIRAAFIAEPGWTLLSADYSQIELRILAHFSEDPVLVEAFRTGQDIHSRTAQEVFGVGPMAQTAEHRRAAKVINFGIIYGLSPFGLAQNLQIEQKEAAKFIAAYFERYRGVKEYLDRSLEEVRRSGFTRTLFGRRRPMPEISSPQFNLRGLAERTALNTPLQGTAADLIKLAMIKIQHELEAQRLRSRMILQVHDELLFEAPPDELAQLQKIVQPAMEDVYPLRVPLVVDIKSGANWRDMQ